MDKIADYETLVLLEELSYILYDLAVHVKNEKIATKLTAFQDKILEQRTRY